jgi:hypothetical protein
VAAVLASRRVCPSVVLVEPLSWALEDEVLVPQERPLPATREPVTEAAEVELSVVPLVAMPHRTEATVLLVSSS